MVNIQHLCMYSLYCRLEPTEFLAYFTNACKIYDSQRNMAKFGQFCNPVYCIIRKLQFCLFLSSFNYYIFSFLMICTGKIFITICFNTKIASVHLHFLTHILSI